MEIRVRATGAVMYEDEWRKLVAKTHGRSVGQISSEAIELFDSDVVFEGPQAQPTRYQIAFRDGVEQQSDGKWYTKYSVADMSDDAKAAHDAAQAAATRETRNNRLKDSDWSQGKDIPDAISTPWATYRQALRDVPQQSGFPWDVTWPTQPE
jgi:hypothetical protein